ncbi:MAG TPA: N-acetylmuramoyl-L-alanine amidase-like domain-containing protein [Longimicrobiales bacterium]|nr:N-acetylmuramoyl-L-alanine amidase-like domain-containing protein [Longimicrobiales bacterium]
MTERVGLKASSLDGVIRGLLVMLLPVLLLACRQEEEIEGGVERSGGEAARAAMVFDVTAEPLDSIIFEEKMAWAREQGLETMPIGDAIVALGRTFVGSPYEPGTLELEGPERLVVNLRELDCVTFIEVVLAMVRTLQQGRGDYASFQQELVRIRYRDGTLAGYPSRLHYFSEWISNNESKGIVRDVTAEVGGQVRPGGIGFMTAHRDAYRQLEDPEVAAEIERIEARLSGEERYYIPQEAIAAHAAGIRNGDIIAATSTLDGLDIAHTGIAVWVGDRLHLMHAPLVGTVVEISERPLAERIQGISAQNGIMVARPQ